MVQTEVLLANINLKDFFRDKFMNYYKVYFSIHGTSDSETVEANGPLEAEAKIINEYKALGYELIEISISSVELVG